MSKNFWVTAKQLRLPVLLVRILFFHKYVRNFCDPLSQTGSRLSIWRKKRECMRNPVNKFLNSYQKWKTRNNLAKTLISLTKSIIIKDLNCFQIMDLTDEERAMQAQVNWWRPLLRFIRQYFAQFLFCKVNFIFMSVFAFARTFYALLIELSNYSLFDLEIHSRWWSLWTIKRRTWSSQWRNGTPRNRPMRSTLHR